MLESLSDIRFVSLFVTTVTNLPSWSCPNLSELQDGQEIALNGFQLKSIILQSLQTLHGQVATSIAFDLLKLEQNGMEAILRVTNSGLTKLWSALTLFGNYQEKECAFRVLQVSPYLLALATDSQQWV